MSPDDSKKKLRGFALQPTDKVREAARKGGSAKRPTKGLGSLSPEARSEIARKGVQARWERARAARQQLVDESQEQQDTNT